LPLSLRWLVYLLIMSYSGRKVLTDKISNGISSQGADK
jgi:hypothetical protein